MSGKASKRHGFLKLLGLLLFAFLFWFGWTCLWVVRESWQQEIHPADAIVVFGAAEYAGRPSPVLRARLDHAFYLFQRGVSPVVITTGGAGDDPKYSEGGVGRGDGEVAALDEPRDDDGGPGPRDLLSSQKQLENSHV